MDKIILIKQNSLPFSVYKIPVRNLKDSLQSKTCVDLFENISAAVAYFLIEVYYSESVLNSKTNKQAVTGEKNNVSLLKSNKYSHFRLFWMKRTLRQKTWYYAVKMFGLEAFIYV